MKPHLGLAEYKSLGIPSGRAAYSRVALEYYDEDLHPTCADFRHASLVFLEKLFREERPIGRIADIGCGQSLVTKFVDRDLVLVDESREMLEKNSTVFEWREIDVIRANFGVAEFDWIFAILGDPYNVPATWGNIERALRPGGKCVFIVPSVEWAENFRASVSDEMPNLARFDLADGATEYLPSYILTADEQRKLISGAGLRLIFVEHVLVRHLSALRSQKTAGYLTGDSAILDIYRVQK